MSDIMNYKIIEEKHKELIDKAKNYMNITDDSEHDINHMNDVVEYTKKILDNIKEVDVEVCIIGAYWHDVGRINGKDNHEYLSAQMLKDTMKSMNYDNEFVNKCCDAIEFHKWNMTPKTIEGLVIKDADKVAWLGTQRWKACINNHQRLDSIINLLPKLRNKLLYFEISKKLYDEEIVKIITILYDEIYK